MKNFAKFTGKTHFLESLSDKVAGFNAWNFNKKIPQHRYFPVNFAKIFQKALFTEHLRMTATADSFFPTKVLSIDHTFVCFFLNFFLFIIDNCQYGSLLRKGIKMNIFLVFTIIYPNISMMVRLSRLDNHLPTHFRENTDFPRQFHSLLY